MNNINVMIITTFQFIPVTLQRQRWIVNYKYFDNKRSFFRLCFCDLKEPCAAKATKQTVTPAINLQLNLSSIFLKK